MSKPKKETVEVRPCLLSGDRDETDPPTNTKTIEVAQSFGDVLHPRAHPVEEAERDLRRFLLEHRIRHDLTPAERIRVLSFVLGDQIQTETKYAIRLERHGNTSKPGDRT